MNKCVLLGRLTKNPEIRYTQTNNVMIANFTLAVNRNYAKEGEERQTDFIKIVAYSKVAEFVNKYVGKGLQICIGGRIQTRTYEDNNGKKQYVTEVIAEEMNFADSPKKADKNILWTNNNSENGEESTIEDDDLPF